MDQNALVQTLENVLTPDTAVIKEATAKLRKDFLSKPESVPALIQVFSTHQNPQVRQLAAVEARTHVPKHWENVPADQKPVLRGALLQATINEPESLVRHAISRVISTIASIDLQDGEWADLIPFIFQASTSDKAANREVGTYILFTVLESLEEEIIVGQSNELFELFNRTIKDPESPAVRLNTVLALGKMAEWITNELPDAVKAFNEILPSMVAVLRELVTADDEKKASNVFEVFQTLLIVESSLTQAHFRDLISFFLELAASKTVEDTYRTKAISWFMSCLRYKKLKIQGLKVGEQITLRALEIATEFPEDEDELDDITPNRSALSLLDYLSASLPPSQVVVPLLNVFPQYTSNPNPNYRRAAVLALGFTVEGAPDFVSTQIDQLIPVILQLLQDPVLEVRKATIQTIARLAEDLPDEIGEAHGKIIPPLIHILDSQDGIETYTRACEAIDAALLGVDDEEASKYLTELMPRFMHLFTLDDTDLKAAAISGIGSAATAAKTAFLPYLQDTMKAISPFVVLKENNEQLELRGVIMEAICGISHAVGPEHFQQYAEPLMHAAKEGLYLDTPRLKETSFTFFSAMARVYCEDFAPFLESVVPALFETLEQEESDFEAALSGSVIIDKVGGEKLDAPGLLDIDPDDIDEDDDDLWEELDSVNALALEKEVAADTLGEILAHCKRGFIPYLSKTVEVLAKKTEHPYEGVRANAIGTLYRAYATFFELESEKTGKWVPGWPVKVQPTGDVKQLGSLVAGCTTKMLEEENDRNCCIEICNNLAETLKLCGPALIDNEATLKKIIDQVSALLNKQHPCQQDIDEDEADQPDLGDSAEYDWQLIESAMDICVGLAKALGEQFGEVWQPFGNVIVRYVSSGEARERSSAVGIIADCVKFMGAAVTPYTSQLFKLINYRLTDEDPKTKSHAAYAMGVLALSTNDKQEIIAEYPSIFEKLGPLLEGNFAAKTRDNAAGCIARMISAAPENVNLSDILPGLAAVLPLKDDYEENEPVYEMLISLYQKDNQVVLQLTPQLLPAFNEVLGDEDQLPEDTRLRLVELIKYLHGKDSAAIDSFPVLAQAARA